jgi:hypothetical protein
VQKPLSPDLGELNEPARVGGAAVLVKPYQCNNMNQQHKKESVSEEEEEEEEEEGAEETKTCFFRFLLGRTYLNGH